jgi:hypothetical protein
VVVRQQPAAAADHEPEIAARLLDAVADAALRRQEQPDRRCVGGDVLSGGEHREPDHEQDDQPQVAHHFESAESEEGEDHERLGRD